jgi:hypothetical protein
MISLQEADMLMQLVDCELAGFDPPTVALLAYAARMHPDSARAALQSLAKRHLVKLRPGGWETTDTGMELVGVAVGVARMGAAIARAVA